MTVMTVTIIMQGSSWEWSTSKSFPAAVQAATGAAGARAWQGCEFQGRNWGEYLEYFCFVSERGGGYVFLV